MAYVYWSAASCAYVYVSALGPRQPYRHLPTRADSRQEVINIRFSPLAEKLL